MKWPKLKKVCCDGFAIFSIAFLAVMATVSIYDYFVHDISESVADYCNRYSFIISPKC